MTTQLIIRQRFDTADLVARHPPRFQHPNKELAYSLTASSQSPAGELTYSRWREAPLPEVVPAASPEQEVREDVFGYETSLNRAPVEWYLDFADPQLFGF